LLYVEAPTSAGKPTHIYSGATVTATTRPNV
jgi:hypothetical protein